MNSKKTRRIMKQKNRNSPATTFSAEESDPEWSSVPAKTASPVRKCLRSSTKNKGDLEVQELPLRRRSRKTKKKAVEDEKENYVETSDVTAKKKKFDQKDDDGGGDKVDDKAEDREDEEQHAEEDESLKKSAQKARKLNLKRAAEDSGDDDKPKTPQSKQKNGVKKFSNPPKKIKLDKLENKDCKEDDLTDDDRTEDDEKVEDKRHKRQRTSQVTVKMKETKVVMKRRKMKKLEQRRSSGSDSDGEKEKSLESKQVTKNDQERTLEVTLKTKKKIKLTEKKAAGHKHNGEEEQMKHKFRELNILQMRKWKARGIPFVMVPLRLQESIASVIPPAKILAVYWSGVRRSRVFVKDEETKKRALMNQRALLGKGSGYVTTDPVHEVYAAGVPPSSSAMAVSESLSCALQDEGVYDHYVPELCGETVGYVVLLVLDEARKEALIKRKSVEVAGVRYKFYSEQTYREKFILKYSNMKTFDDIQCQNFREKLKDKCRALGCEIPVVSRHYMYFHSSKSATRALDKLSGEAFNGRKIFLMRSSQIRTNLIIKNLPNEIIEQDMFKFLRKKGIRVDFVNLFSRKMMVHVHTEDEKTQKKLLALHQTEMKGALLSISYFDEKNTDLIFWKKMGELKSAGFLLGFDGRFHRLSKPNSGQDSGVTLGRHGGEYK